MDGLRGGGPLPQLPLLDKLRQGNGAVSIFIAVEGERAHDAIAVDQARRDLRAAGHEEAERQRQMQCSQRCNQSAITPVCNRE